MADTGWVSPTQAENVDRDGERSWASPTDVLTQNDDQAWSMPYATSYTDWIRAFDFEFSIPEGATIDGIEVRMDKYCANGADIITDSSLRLSKDSSTLVGDDKADTVTLWPGSDTDTYIEYGGSADDWNASLTRADVNSEGFGVHFSCYNTESAQKVSKVDHIQMKVHYTEGGGGDSDENITKFNENLNGMINNGLN